MLEDLVTYVAEALSSGQPHERGWEVRIKACQSVLAHHNLFK